MRVVILIVLASCATVTPIDVTTASHAFVDAYYRGDLASVAPQLGSDYVQLGRSSPVDREHELAKLRARKPDEPIIVNRAWSDEHTLATREQTVFVGRALETTNGRGAVSDGRYTLVWRFEAGAWRLASFEWNPVLPESTAFDDVYRSDAGFEKAPNKLLAKTLESLAPGTALDLMCGQGRNVIYEASRGWRATGIDYSAVGIDRARKTASDRKLDVELLDEDLDKTELGVATYDLVSMLYAGADPKLIAKAQAALKPGGTFVFEYFAAGVPNMDGPEPGQLAKLFAGYDVTLDEQVDDAPDWVLTRAKLQRFVARKPEAAK